MCDYSITAKKQLKAAKGQDIVSSKFGGISSTGFAPKGSDGETAVCLLPGTELAFKRDVMIGGANYGRTARFRQLNKEAASMHHDHLEFANGNLVVLGHLDVGLEATVLQLPAPPKTAAEAAEQKRAEYIG